MAQVQTDLVNLKALSLKVVSTAELMEEAFQIAFDYRISAYDGAYVALSHRTSVPLLTLDQRLVNALANTFYDVLSFGDFSLL